MPLAWRLSPLLPPLLAAPWSLLLPDVAPPPLSLRPLLCSLLVLSLSLPLSLADLAPSLLHGQR
jgi:hypothetical protein